MYLKETDANKRLHPRKFIKSNKGRGNGHIQGLSKPPAYDAVEVMVIVRGCGRRWSGWFAPLITNIYLRCCYLQYTSVLSLSNKESVIMDVVILVHALGKQGKIKAVPALTRCLAHWLHNAALIG